MTLTRFRRRSFAHSHGLRARRTGCGVRWRAGPGIAARVVGHQRWAANLAGGGVATPPRVDCSGSTLRWIRSEQAGLGGVVGANVSGSIRDVVGSTGLASRQRVCVSEGAGPVYRSSPIGRFRRVVRQALHSAGCLSYSGPVLMGCCWQTTFTGFLRQLLSGGFFSSLIRLQQFHSTCCFRHAASSAGARSAFLGLCVAEEAKSLADKKGGKTTGRRAMTGKFAELLLAQQMII